MTVLKRYVLRLFMSLKYVTANIVDRNNGRIVATASTVEHSIKTSLECGRTCNAKAVTIVGEVLAMRLKVEGREYGQGRGIHVDVTKELEKKRLQKPNKVTSGSQLSQPIYLTGAESTEVILEAGLILTNGEGPPSRSACTIKFVRMP